MSFDIPARPVIFRRIMADVERYLTGVVQFLRVSFEVIFAKMLALVSHDMHVHIAKRARALHVMTAVEDELSPHAAFWRVTRRPATLASGSIVFTGLTDCIVPAGALVQRADGVRFALLEDARIDTAGVAIASVQAESAGSAANTPAGQTVTLVEPVVGVQSQATVGTGGIGGGLDIEDWESVRARISARIDEPPGGGNEADYRRWVSDVVGATRVWVKADVGNVSVAFIMPDGSIPDTEAVARVHDYIHDPDIRPMCATIVIWAPAEEPVDLTITLQPDSLATRHAVETELRDFFIREAEPGGTLPMSRVQAAVSAARGEYAHRVIEPVDDIMTEADRIARLGVITWQT